MFKPAWDMDLSKSVVAPLSVQYGFEASPKWHADHPGAMDAVGNFLLDQNAPLLMNWLQGQRQNARNSQLMIYSSQFRLPGIRAQYVRRFGYETLRLVAQPENAGGKIPTKIIINGGLDFNYKFHNYPIPAASSLGGLAPMWNNLYYPDFASTPGWWTSAFNEKPISGSGGTALQFSASWGGAPPDISETTGFWPEGAYDRIAAGSTFVTPKLSGRQYWEVKIKTLPPFSVPADNSFTGSANAFPTIRFTDTNTYTDDQGTMRRSYPPQLNSWMTPTIGVLTGDAVPSSGNFTPALIGLDKTIIHGPRSIGAFPIGYTHFHKIEEHFNTPFWNITGSGGGFTNSTATDAAWIIATEHGGNNLVSWSFGQAIVTTAGHWFKVSAEGTGWARGPDSVSPGDPDPTAGGTATFRLSGEVGSGAYNPLWPGPGQPEFLPGTAITFVPSSWTLQANRTEDRMQGDIFGYSWQTGPGPSRDTVVLKTLPPDAVEDQKYMPVIKGRPDNMTWLVERDGAGNNVRHDDYTAYRPTDEVPVFITIDDVQNAFWTGIDLSEPKEGDVYMVATDTTNGAAYIWFGKNGFWYLSGEGKVKASQATLTATNCAASLDVRADDPSKTADYYAAVSYRMGPISGTFQGAGSTQHGPPVGFKALNIQAPLTIRGPDKDAPA